MAPLINVWEAAPSPSTRPRAASRTSALVPWVPQSMPRNMLPPSVAEHGPERACDAVAAQAFEVALERLDEGS